MFKNLFNRKFPKPVHRVNGIFTARYCAAVYAVVLCPSVRLSQAGTVPALALCWCWCYYLFIFL